MDDQLFDQIDKNQDGLLSLEEIQEALSNPDIPEQTIKALFETFDANEDGFISREEAMKRLVQVPAGKEKLVEEFKILDLNGNITATRYCINSLALPCMSCLLLACVLSAKVLFFNQVT